MSQQEQEQAKSGVGGQERSATKGKVETAAAMVHLDTKGNSVRSEAEVLERVFLSDDLLPDPASSFQAVAPAVEEAIKTADIVLDTNVLLLPYGAGSSSLTQIIKALKSLAVKRRLFLPGQVVREFIRNRPNKLSELQQQLLDKISRFQSIDQLSFPILEGNQEYVLLNDALAKTTALKRELSDASAAVIRKIKAWEWNDPVNTAYRTVFLPDTIISPTIERSEVLVELKRRQRLQVPPGYKDAGKDDLGIGDFLIWLTILKIGKANKKPLIFVSGDEKADWQHRSGGAGFVPRYELLDEYRRSSGGKPFYIVPLSKLLELLDVEKVSIDEIKHEEVRVQEASSVVVPCPDCGNEVPCRLGEYIGATAHPRCQVCSTQFHVHRTRSGVIVREHGVPRIREEITQPEEVSCPGCNAKISTKLGLQFNATQWCKCEECGADFPIHRRADSGVTVSRPRPTNAMGE